MRVIYVLLQRFIVQVHVFNILFQMAHFFFFGDLGFFSSICILFGAFHKKTKEKKPNMFF